MRKPITLSRLPAVAMGSGALMYHPSRIPRLVCWLLATIVAFQPAPGFSCGCNGGGKESGSPAARKRCCCCCSGQRCSCCCGLAHRDQPNGKPQRRCCQHRASQRDSSPAVCRCGSGAPTAPPSVPTQRNPTDDLTAAALYVYAAAADTPTAAYAVGTAHHPAEFASASAHCVALGRLLI